MKNTIWLNFPSGRECRTPQKHWFQVRDAGAFVEINACLSAGTATYSEILLDQKGTKFEPKWFNGNNLLVCTTRPPLSDDSKSTISYISAGDSLVWKTMKCWLEKWFETLSRVEIKLKSTAAANLRPKYEDRKFIRVSRSIKPVYLKLEDNRLIDDTHTPGFLLFHPRLWDGGPACLLLWGMDGVETYRWAYWWSRYNSIRLRKLVRGNKEVFIMGEWEALSEMPEDGFTKGFLSLHTHAKPTMITK